MTVGVNIKRAFSTGRSTATVKIKPGNFWARIDLKEIWFSRELLYFLAWRDIKVRYKQTALGIAWVLLQPTATTIVFSILFSNFGKIDTGAVPYALFAFSGFVLWSFISIAVVNSGNSLISQPNLITKVYFPRLIVPLAAVIAALFDLLISIAVLVLATSIFGAPLSWKIFFLPFFVALLATLIFSLGTILAALNVRFRDVRNVLPFALQLWLFGSPVFYPLTVLPENWRWVWQINPLAGILQGLRFSLFGDEFDLPTISIAVIFSFAMLFIALYVFRRMEDDFADLI